MDQAPLACEDGVSRAHLVMGVFKDKKVCCFKTYLFVMTIMFVTKAGQVFTIPTMYKKTHIS